MITSVTIKNILTRTSGYLQTVTSHSLQPYRGCSYGRSLCGVSCYVQHNRHVVQNRPWGSFLEARTNAAQSYLAFVERERKWAHSNRDGFSIFCSSATDPFVPQERSLRITRSVLEVMLQSPPDTLILQTHSDRVTDYIHLYRELSAVCALRVHLSIESDREHLPGLPPPACSVARRIQACRQLTAAGLQTVVTVSPLLPIQDPRQFFRCLSEVCSAVVIDHFIEGDGSPDGRRTQKTALPAAMQAIDPDALKLDYRDEIASVAREFFPGRVGISINGFAGRYT